MRLVLIGGDQGCKKTLAINENREGNYMKRFKNILVIYNGTESGQSALYRAIDLTTRNEARLTVLQVITQIPSDYRMLITSLSPEEIMENAVKEHTELLEKHIAHFSKADRIEVRVVAGREFIEIIKEVLRNNHDLVVKTARGMSGKIGQLFGSTAMHLLRKCPCPVWLIKQEQGQVYGRVMAAVDVMPSDMEENDLNKKIMDLATSLAEIEKSALDIVHAWEKPSTNILAGGVDYFPGDINELFDDARNMHVKWLEEFLEQYDLQHLQHHEHVLEGWADEVIPEFAEQHHVDLIVMGTVCRTGISGFFIGNTAEKILNNINCSVLAVKPEGFVSPVQIDDK